MEDPEPFLSDEDWVILNTVLEGMAWLLGAYKPLMFIARQIDIYFGLD